MTEKTAKNHIVSVDKYLVEHAQQKVREQNGGQIVKPVLKEDRPQSETPPGQDQESSR